MKKFPLLFVLIIIFSITKGQDSDKGFDFFISAGMYQGNKYQASYYNGNNQDINIGRVLGNTILKEQIDRSVSESGVIMDSKGIILEELPETMHYNWKFAINLGVAYRINEEFSLIASVGQVKLNAHSYAVFSYNKGVSGNQTADYLNYDLLGKERRNFLDVGFKYTQITENRVHWFLEFTAQLASVKVESADLIVEGDNYTMIDFYGGADYDPTIYQTVIDPMLGGIGYGGCLLAGLKINVNEWVALEPFAQIQYTHLPLSEPYRFKPSYNVGVRINLNDHFFSNR